MFAHEISKLEVKDQLRFKTPKFTFARADGELLEVDIVKELTGPLTPT